MTVIQAATVRLARFESVERALCAGTARWVVRPTTVALMRAVSRFGDWGLSVAVGLLLGFMFGWLHVAAWTLISVTAVLIQSGLKKVCRRVRPCQRPGGPPQRAPIPDHGSFPSGHTLHATLAAVALINFLPLLALPAIAVAVIMGVSRVVLGVHYPSDVLAGGSLGLLFGNVFCLLV
jgi:undecaprenyl-diphosphatase